MNHFKLYQIENRITTENQIEYKIRQKIRQQIQNSIDINLLLVVHTDYQFEYLVEEKLFH